MLKFDPDKGTVNEACCQAALLHTEVQVMAALGTSAAVAHSSSSSEFALNIQGPTLNSVQDRAEYYGATIKPSLATPIIHEEVFLSEKLDLKKMQREGSVSFDIEREEISVFIDIRLGTSPSSGRAVV